jgi:steroid delta-isomerase-like uncharacterized protein
MATASVTAELTETEERNLRSVADVLQFWNAGDIEGIVAFYDDEIVWKNMGLEETYVGKQGVREFLTRLFTAIPDLAFTVDFKIARGDNVSEQWTVKGTHLGPFMGIPPTGRPVEIRALSMVTMRDGKFLRDEFYWDTGAVMRQMGLMPSLAFSQGALSRGFLWIAVKSLNIATAGGRAGRKARRTRGQTRSD